MSHYSIQSKDSASFDIYLSDDLSEAEKQEILTKQFRIFYPDYDIEIVRRSYGFFVSVEFKPCLFLFFEVVKL